MATVYKPYIGVTTSGEGLPFWMMSGEEVEVDGQTCVRSSTVISTDRHLWHDTREAAAAAAGDAILAVAERLKEQAAAIRAGGKK